MREVVHIREIYGRDIRREIFGEIGEIYGNDIRYTLFLSLWEPTVSGVIYGSYTGNYPVYVACIYRIREIYGKYMEHIRVNLPETPTTLQDRDATSTHLTFYEYHVNFTLTA